MAKSATALPDEVQEAQVTTEPLAEIIDRQERLKRADQIIRKNVYWSMGVGAVPVPLVDLVGIGAIQLRTVKEISELYGVTFCEHAARNIIGALVGTIGGGVLTKLTVASFIKTLPFAGAVIGGILALPAIAGASTYALGKVFVNHFEKGGTFLDLSPEKVKTYFGTQYAAGKKVVVESVKGGSAKTTTATPVEATVN